MSKFVERGRKDAFSNGDPAVAYPEGVSHMFVTEGGWPGNLRDGAMVTTYFTRHYGIERTQEGCQFCTPLLAEEGEEAYPIFYRLWVDRGGEQYWTEWEREA